MINFNDLIQPFVSGLKNPSCEKLVNPDDTINENAIKAALNLGFPDITPRTMNDRDAAYKAQGKKEFAEMPDALFAYRIDHQHLTFGEMLKKWFEEKPKDWKAGFETLHKNACETVKSFLKSQLYGENSCTYGKAQKVVNMTFKHIYCLSEGKKREWFLNCHMALDFFTLEWFKRNIAKYGQLGKVDNWSALQNPKDQEYTGKDNKQFYSYHFLVAEIQKYFDENHPFGPLCPLEAEFIIWPDIQMHLSAENFIFQLDPKTYGGNDQKTNAKKQAVKDQPIDKLLAIVEEKIAQYRGQALPLTQTTEYQTQGRKIIYCPVCGSRTLDGGYICHYCQWKSDN